MPAQEAAKERLTAEEVFTKSQKWERKLDPKSPKILLSDEDLYNLITDVVAIRYAYGLNRFEHYLPYDEPYTAQIKNKNATYRLFSSPPSKPNISSVERYAEAADLRIQENLKIAKSEKDGVEKYLIERMSRFPSPTTGEWQWIATTGEKKFLSNFERQKWAQTIWRAHKESMFPADETYQLEKSPLRLHPFAHP